jgi:hypothetical protein
MEKPRPFLTIREVAEILRYSPHEARRLCSIGRELAGIRAIKHGKRGLVSPKVLEEWADRQQYVPHPWCQRPAGGHDYSRSVYTPPKSPGAVLYPKAN